jgi:hypothetical protein
MAHYQTITGVYGYRYGIYDNGAAVIQARKDGRRYRVMYDCVRWQGNTGGHHTEVIYLTRAEGRRRIRQVRRAQIAAAHGQWDGRTVLEIIAGY